MLGNRKYLNKIKKYIIDHDVQQIENPIEYPDFYNFPINRCDLTDLCGGGEAFKNACRGKASIKVCIRFEFN